MPRQLGQLRRVRTGGEQLDVERDAEQGGRRRVGGDRGQDAVGGHPRRQHELDAGVQAVEQAADQTEHVHHRGERDDPLAGLRHPVDPRVALDLLDEVAAVRPMTFDGPVEPELSWMSACAVSAGRPG